MFTILKRVIFSVFIFLVFLGLTGCVKGEVSIEVKDDGSGLVGASIGLTKQAKALLSTQSQSGDLMTEIQKSLGEQGFSSQKVQAKTWIDGDYEWVQVQKEVNSIDEINQAFANNKLFKSFSLARKRGLLQNEFILDAELSPLSEEQQSTGSFNIDPSAFMEMSFSLRLPGIVKETNGFTDVTDPNKSRWNIHGNESVHIKARSVAWNWVNITILAVLVILLTVGLVGVLGFSIFLVSRKKSPVSPSKA